ncbi:DnaJsubfamily B member 8 [Sesamum angolense]|uniref:DnaJsubfamily B member 8 n=1 Tax=Sesamum angolense TaxID=2727404 RepID=A0AAE1XDX9_9LAMI|nr:DnaJsubfamily B member 8 [Sesamum angolense]
MENSKGLPFYYGVLGVSLCSSDEEIRRAYRKLAMQWHPDKWTRTLHLLLGQPKFQQIQEAYSVLSDAKKRASYDADLYDPDDDEEDEIEGKIYSIEELRSMFWEMSKSFEINPEWCSGSMQQPPQWLRCPFTLYETETTTRNSWEATDIVNQHLTMSAGFDTYVTNHVFR